MRKLIYLFVVSMLVNGCATGYQAKGFGGGYADMRMQDDIFKVSFRGNGYTDKERTADFALLRSAEITLENGYKYFVILQSTTDIRTSAFTTPVTAQTEGSVNAYSTGTGFSSGTYSGTTQYSGGETQFIHKPSTSMTFQCFKDKPTNVSGMVYDAEQIEVNIRKAYKLDAEIKTKEGIKPVNKTDTDFKG
jgi:hypothetical protein